MRRITAWILMLIMSVSLVAAGSAEKTEADGSMAKEFDASCFTENRDYFRTDVSEDGQTAFIQTLVTAENRAFTTPYENDLYYSAIFPELMITNWHEEEQIPFFRIWIRYRGTKQLNIKAVSLIIDGTDYRFLDVSSPDWIATKEDGTAAQDVQLVLGSTPINATCFAILFSKAIEYAQAQMGDREASKPEVSMILVGDETVKADLPADFWSEMAAFAYSLDSINGFSFLTSIAGTSCIIMK